MTTRIHIYIFRLDIGQVLIVFHLVHFFIETRNFTYFYDIFYFSGVCVLNIYNFLLPWCMCSQYIQFPTSVVYVFSIYTISYFSGVCVLNIYNFLLQWCMCSQYIQLLSSGSK